MIWPAKLILFNKCSIVCLPSYREGFPKSLIEASSSGCAIITTNVTGCRDVIKKNYNGLLSKPRNVDDLKHKQKDKHSLLCYSRL